MILQLNWSIISHEYPYRTMTQILGSLLSSWLHDAACIQWANKITDIRPFSRRDIAGSFQAERLNLRLGQVKHWILFDFFQEMLVPIMIDLV